MQINEINKKIYEDAFICTGEYGQLNSWKPSIDEREIQEWSCDENGNEEPATPLGYRDYIESRIDGIKRILNKEETINLDEDRFRQIKRDDNTIRLYDKITINEGRDFVVVGDDDELYYVVDENNQLFSVKYV